MVEPDRPLFQELQRRHRQRMDGARGDMAYRVSQAAQRSAPDPTVPYTPADRQRALREIELVLDEYYGSTRGDERATVLRIIVEDARAALVAAYDLSILVLEDRLRAGARRRPIADVIRNAARRLVRRIRG